MDINTSNTNNPVYSDSLSFLGTTTDVSQKSVVEYYNNLAANTNTSFNSMSLLDSILNPIQDPSTLSPAACAMLMGNSPFNSTNLLNSIFNPLQDPSTQMTNGLQNFFSPSGSQLSTFSTSTSSSQDPLGLLQQNEEADEDIESEDAGSEEDIEYEEE